LKISNLTINNVGEALGALLGVRIWDYHISAILKYGGFYIINLYVERMEEMLSQTEF